ncbi:MAG: branched-chain amino acid ABC transporter permease [Geminicoccaceae bacterium]
MVGSGSSGGWLTAPMAITLVLLASLPFWIEQVGLYQYLGVEVVIWMIYALGFNLLLGLSGLPSFGHGAYFGIGAYAFGLFQLHAFESLWLGLGAAIAGGLVAGAIVACFLSHRRGIYFALMTIAFGQVFWFTAINWYSLTGGEDGLLDIPRPDVTLGPLEVALTGNRALFYFALVVLALVLIALWRLVHSPFGKALSAIKQNEMRAAFIGYNVWLYKWLVFTLSAAIAGLAGGLFAMAQQSAYPDVMNLNASGFVVMMVLIGGGMVSFWGPVIGTAVFFVARDVLGAATESWVLWYGLLFMAVVLFKPEGIAGLFRGAEARRSSARPTPAPAA